MRDSFPETQEAAPSPPTSLQAQVAVVPEANRYCTTLPSPQGQPPTQAREPLRGWGWAPLSGLQSLPSKGPEHLRNWLKVGSGRGGDLLGQMDHVTKRNGEGGPEVSQRLGEMQI